MIPNFSWLALIYVIVIYLHSIFVCCYKWFGRVFFQGFLSRPIYPIARLRTNLFLFTFSKIITAHLTLFNGYASIAFCGLIHIYIFILFGRNIASIIFSLSILLFLFIIWTETVARASTGWMMGMATRCIWQVHILASTAIIWGSCTTWHFG